MALLVVAPLFVGCADDLAGSEGDCNARIEWDGVVYRPHNALNQAAPRGERLGSGEVLDCDRSGVATVVVFAVEGVDAAVAIRIGDKLWRGVYVAEKLPRSSWPQVLESG